MKIFLYLLLIATLLTSGCRSQTEDQEASKAPVQKGQTAVSTKQPAPARPHEILSTRMDAHLLELPTDALPVWRSYKELKPTLILLSDDPFLQSIPEELVERARDLVLQGEPSTFRTRVAPFTPDPILLPNMAVSAALRAGLFARIVWVLPADTLPEKVSLSTFKEQILNFGAVTPEEAETFRQDGYRFIGTVRGVPFQAVFPFALPAIEQPAVVHIDLSYFRPFYKNEISTPLLPIVYRTLEKLRQTQWHTLAISLSLSNLDGSLSLETRFIGGILQDLFLDPSLLHEPAPLTWQRHKDILYLENLMQPEKILEVALVMERDEPDSAAVQFALYQAYRAVKDGEKALNHLHRAVELDPTYSVEYMNLAPMARQKGRPDEAVRMLQLAAAALPENPFISLHLAQAYQIVGKKDEALKVIDRLNARHWSPVYYPQAQENLQKFRAAVATIETPEQHSATTDTANKYEMYRRR